MTDPAASPRRSIAERLYRRLLRLYPEPFRRAHGDDMAELFADLCGEEERRRGRRGVLMLLVRMLVQLPGSLFAAWCSLVLERRRELEPGGPPPPLSAGPGVVGRFRENALHGARSFVKTPAFTAVAVLTLGLGVGANTAIFSVVYGVLLRPLALEAAADLVLLQVSETGGAFPGVSPIQLEDWREHGASFDGIAAWAWDNVILRDGDEVEALDNVLAVSGNFFSLLGVEAIHGRALLAEDELPNRRGNVVVIGEELWRGRWGGDPDILGRTLLLDGTPMEVVGVMPAHVPVPPATRMWFPQGFGAEDLTFAGRLMPVARLRQGVDPGTARAELERLSRLLEERHPELEATTVDVRPVLDSLTGATRPALLLIGAAVGLVLLISCANLANLMLARAAVREREMATRRALGAGRGQILGQVLTESLVLAGAGAVAGIGLAFLGHRLVVATAPGILPRLDAVRLDLPVLLFSTVLALVAGVLFGLAPALHALAVDMSRALHSSSRGLVGSRAFSRARTALLVAQIAVAATLLVGAGLLLRSLLALRAVDPGFAAEGVVAARINLDEHSYTDETEAIYFRSLQERLRNVPGVRSVGASSGLPVDPVSLDFEIGWERPDAPTAEGQTPPSADFRVVTPGYFATMGIPLLEGRDFGAQDTDASEPVLILNRRLAASVWPDESALDKELVVHFYGRHRLRVVGVVGDVLSRGLAAQVRPEVFVAHAQAPFSSMSVVLRGSLDAGPLVAAVRREALELDPSQPVESAYPLTLLLADSLARDRFYTTMLALFAALAALLAAAGIYAVIAYWVNQSRKEIGLRLALGAGRRQVRAMVVRRSLAVTAAGLLLGIAGSLVSGRFLASMVFGVELVDPLVLVGVTLLLGAAALAASFLPARQASRLDPVRTLKLEG